MTHKEGIGMYNEKTKNIYLEALPNPKVVKSYLNKIEPFEVELNKDLGEFSASETKDAVLAVIKQLKAGKSTYVFSSHIKKYLLWYHDTYEKDSFDIVEIFREINKEKDNNINYYKSFLDFFMDLNSCIYNEVLKQNFSQELIKKKRQMLLDKYNVALSSALLAWIGLSNNEICELKTKDVDFDNCVINLPDRKVPFNDLVCISLKTTVESDVYIDNDGMYGRYETSCYVIRRQQVGGSTMFEEKMSQSDNKAAKEPKNNKPVLKEYIQRRLMWVMPGMDLRTIRENGSFVRMYESMKKNKVLKNELFPKRTDNSKYIEDWILALPEDKRKSVIHRFRLFVRDINKL